MVTNEKLVVKGRNFELQLWTAAVNARNYLAGEKVVSMVYKPISSDDHVNFLSDDDSVSQYTRVLSYKHASSPQVQSLNTNRSGEVVGDLTHAEKDLRLL